MERKRRRTIWELLNDEEFAERVYLPAWMVLFLLVGSLVCLLSVRRSLLLLVPGVTWLGLIGAAAAQLLGVLRNGQRKQVLRRIPVLGLVVGSLSGLVWWSLLLMGVNIDASAPQWGTSKFLAVLTVFYGIHWFRFFSPWLRIKTRGECHWRCTNGWGIPMDIRAYFYPASEHTLQLCERLHGVMEAKTEQLRAKAETASAKEKRSLAEFDTAMVEDRLRHQATFDAVGNPTILLEAETAGPDSRTSAVIVQRIAAPSGNSVEVAFVVGANSYVPPGDLRKITPWLVRGLKKESNFRWPPGEDRPVFDPALGFPKPIADALGDRAFPLSLLDEEELGSKAPQA